MIIYKITNKINSKVYIGQTVRTLEERISEHRRNKNCIMYKAFEKHGFRNFKFEIIDEASNINELNQKEINWINFYNCLSPIGYNQCEGGCNTLGYHHREDSKQKMSEHKKGRYTKEENHFYGKTHTDKQKAKWSEQRKGRVLSDEWKENLKKSHVTRKVKNLDTGEIFDTVKEAGEKYSIEPTHITRVCRGKRKSTGGYRWSYTDTDKSEFDETRKCLYCGNEFIINKYSTMSCCSDSCKSKNAYKNKKNKITS